MLSTVGLSYVSSGTLKQLVLCSGNLFSYLLSCIIIGGQTAETNPVDPNIALLWRELSFTTIGNKPE